MPTRSIGIEVHDVIVLCSTWMSLKCQQVKRSGCILKAMANLINTKLPMLASMV